MQGTASATWCMSRSDSEPSSQFMMSMAAKGLGDRLSARLMPAPASVPTAIPASTSVSGLSLRLDRRRSGRRATSAPPIARSGSARGCASARPK